MRLEPPLQRSSAPAKLRKIGRKSKIREEPICCHDVVMGGSMQSRFFLVTGRAGELPILTQLLAGAVGAAPINVLTKR